MTAAVYALAACFIGMAGLAAAAMALDYTVIAWAIVVTLIVALLTLLGMIASTGRAQDR